MYMHAMPRYAYYYYLFALNFVILSHMIYVLQYVCACVVHGISMVKSGVGIILIFFLKKRKQTKNVEK